MSEREREYAELLLAWARTIHEHRLSFEEYERRALEDKRRRITIHHAEGVKS